MRRFIVIAAILILAVSLVLSMAGNLILYNFHQRKQVQLDARIEHVETVESRLGEAQTGRQEAEDRLATLEPAGRTLQAQIATLEAQVAKPSIPTPTPPTRPSIYLTSPTSGAQFQERERVIVRWNAVNPDGIGRVTLRVDGRPVSETPVNGAHTAEGEFTWFAAGLGLHQLSLVAANTVGIESAPVSVTIEVVPATGSQRPADPGAESVAIMDAIEAQVIELRGLASLFPVTRTFNTHDELSAFIVKELDEEFPPSEAQRNAVEMAAFDFLPAETDLRALMQAVYTEQIAGFYDSDTQSFALVSEDDELSALEKAVYAHEFTHALQDQHYDLEALDPEENSDDASLAVTALIEGDATLSMQQYALAHLSADELFEMLSESGDLKSPILDRAPDIIQAQLMFPYEAGLVFVQALYQDGGYEAVDDAFLNPPRSTEQILHPERYLAGEQPLPVSLPPLTNTLGGGWRWVDGNVLGEFFLQRYLDQQVSASSAAAAADGWGGDRYAVHQNEESGQIVMVMCTVWDSEDEAAEFWDIFRPFGVNRFAAEPEIEETAICWDDQEAMCAYRAGAETLVIRAPDLETVRELAALFPEFR